MKLLGIPFFLQGHDLISIKPSIVRSKHYRHIYNVPNRCNKLLLYTPAAFSTCRSIQHSCHLAAKLTYTTPLLTSSFLGGRRFRMNAAGLDVGGAVEVINDLGLDTLTFLAVTVLVVPAFKIVKASPVSLYFILSYNQILKTMRLLDDDDDDDMSVSDTWFFLCGSGAQSIWVD